MKNLQDLVASLEHKPGTAKSWRTDEGAKESLTFEEYHRRVIALSKAFSGLGIKPDDHVMHVADNNPDWVAVSLALNNIGAVDVPRGSDSSEEELAYILDHSDAKYLLVKDERTYEKLADAIPERVRAVVSLEGDFAAPLEQLVTAFADDDYQSPPVDEDDLSCIIYTSGTTGKPKGVMLTHKNFLSNFPILAEVEGMRDDDVWMSILPPWHVFQRAAEYCSLHTSAEMFHTTPAKAAQELAEIRPTIFPTVPRLWESIYAKAMKQTHRAAQEMSGPSGVLLRAMLRGGIIPKLYVPGKVKDSLQERVGGRMRFAVSGGGPLPGYLDDYFRKAGIDIVEGYGMTETSPVIAARVRGEGKKSRYTVGYPLPNVDVRIADPDTNEPLLPRMYGEVQVSGPLVMKGYYKDSEGTRRALVDDGDGKEWLKTGDRGRFDRYGHLKLRGRYKDIILGPDGENIDPTSLEERLTKHDLVEHSLVFRPEGSRFLFALIVPHEASLREYCEEHGISYGSLAEALETPGVRDAYNELLRMYNGSAKQHHRIKGWRLLDSPLKVGQEITTTLKLKRKEILESRRYEAEGLVSDKGFTKSI
ncbi:AMP-binding protein [Candidatus Woesearchaeota archaeon]|nr:AMP-binding protein [Candidatus Woesearchaeota archaeon]